MGLTVMTPEWASLIASVLRYHCSDRKRRTNASADVLRDPMAYFNRWARASGHSVSDVSLALWCVEDYLPNIAKMSDDRLVQSVLLDGLKIY